MKISYLCGLFGALRTKVRLYMQFTTPIDIPRSPWEIRYDDRILFLGSCFSDHVAAHLQQYYFQVTANPLGTLYNPVSIVHHSDLFGQADVVLVTFGTAWVYIDNLLPATDNPLDRVVDNCRKRPAAEFTRYRLSKEEIVSLWLPVLNRYADKRFVFTVSPIRHIKDGLHENQLSKAVLLSAVDELVQRVSLEGKGRVNYFPAYEILLDELRDYRFYAADMMHPSEVAVEYIFSRFAETYLYDAGTQADMRTLHQLYLDSHHRPLHPDSEEYKAFAKSVRSRRDELRKRFPWLPDINP